MDTNEIILYLDCDGVILNTIDKLTMQKNQIIFLYIFLVHL